MFLLNYAEHYLSLGVVGLAGYLYLEKSGAGVVPKKVQEKSPFDPENFVDFKLKRVEPYNHNTAKYVPLPQFIPYTQKLTFIFARYIFELPNGEASLLPVASCVVVKSSEAAAPLLDTKGKPVIRPYTPVSPPDLEGELSFLIKRYEEGKMSQYIHGLKPGETLAIKGPIMKFPYQGMSSRVLSVVRRELIVTAGNPKANQFEEVGMIAGGSGITPMYQILEHALKDKSNKTKFTLIFANVTPKDILMKEEFDDLKKKYPDTLNVIYTVDKTEPDWQGTF